MTIEDLARLVLKCRAAQRKYFADRSQQNLQESKDHERRLDLAVAEILTPLRPTLFDEPIK